MDTFIKLINQLTEVKQKISQESLEEKFERNFNRIYSILEEEGYTCIYPLGEKYNETRTDCEANIIGEEGEKMIITQIIKPIIYKKESGVISLLQKGIVMVESK